MHSLLTLYSDPLCPNCHRVRLLAAEKEDLVEIINVHPHELPEQLLEINPYGTLPTIHDRDVVLYEAQVIMEYIDERFPNPLLLPSEPIQRAKIRMMLAIIREYWYPSIRLLDDINTPEEQREKARDTLKSHILDLKSTFKHYEYCMSDEYTLVDITIAPIFWRLKKYQISTKDFGIDFDLYIKKIFLRKAFLDSLSIFEENMQ